MKKEKYDVTLSIVTYNHARTINDILRKAEAALKKDRLRHRIIVVDSASTDGTADLIRREFPRILVIVSANRGYGAGQNIAMRLSMKDSRYHAAINPDITFPPGTIRGLFEYLEKNTDVSLVTPKIVYPDGRLQYLCKLLPTPLDFFVRRLLPLPILLSWINERFEMRASGYRAIMPVPFISGCFMMMRTSALQRSGLFDENYFLFCEDIDLTRRLHQFGTTMFHPSLRATHDHMRKSFLDLKMFFIYLRSTLYYFNKWGWFFDKERKRTNREAMDFLKKMKNGTAR
ncbi:MAG: glycosyltransferase family 2 protein [Spirochaetota bacterium]